MGTDQSNPSHASLVDDVRASFQTKFGRPASVIVAAPGRVNLIGEHIDYNDGFVMPLALDRYILIAADAAETDAAEASQGDADAATAPIHFHSLEFDSTDAIRRDQGFQPGRKDWLCYVEGVLSGFVDLGEEVPAFDAVVGSTVPLGGGLSSSAALEVATATLMEELTGHRLTKLQKALLCQKAEHTFAGVPCGIMDQFSSVFGEDNQLMLIDCRSQEIEFVPFETDDISVLITNSNVKHQLAGGEYASRRSQCDSALASIGKSTWRDVTLDDVDGNRSMLSESEWMRSRHVVTEISRTMEAANAFRTGDWNAAGKLMYASHASLRDHFEVSCPELDALVEIAAELGTDGGVIGSRMTGGGFGGCTVSLVRNECLDSVKREMTKQYKARTGIQSNCFSTRPGRGAHVVLSHESST